MDKCLNLFLQSLPDTRTFGLKNQSLRGIAAIDKLENAILQTVKCIFQREINHGAWLYFSIPDRITLRDLQTQPQGQPAFARLAGAGKSASPAGSKPGTIHFTGGSGVESSSSAEIAFGSLVKVICIIPSCLVYIYYLIVS